MILLIVAMGFLVGSLEARTKSAILAPSPGRQEEVKKMDEKRDVEFSPDMESKLQSLTARLQYVETELENVKKGVPLSLRTLSADPRCEVGTYKTKKGDNKYHFTDRVKIPFTHAFASIPQVSVSVSQFERARQNVNYGYWSFEVRADDITADSFLFVLQCTWRTILRDYCFLDRLSMKLHARQNVNYCHWSFEVCADAVTADSFYLYFNALGAQFYEITASWIACQ